MSEGSAVCIRNIVSDGILLGGAAGFHIHDQVRAGGLQDRGVMEVRHALRDKELGQGRCGLEDQFPERGHTVRDLQDGQGCAALKGPSLDLLQGIGQGHLHQRGAVDETSLRKNRHPIRHGHGLQGPALVKGVVPDLSQGRRQIDLRQGLAALESGGLNPGQSRRQSNLRQGKAPLECFFRNSCDTARNLDPLQLLTAREDLHAHGIHERGQGDSRQVGAFRDGISAQRHEAVRKGKLRQGRDIVEGIGGDGCRPAVFIVSARTGGARRCQGCIPEDPAFHLRHGGGQGDFFQGFTA